jgi:hypothetical protein
LFDFPPHLEVGLGWGGVALAIVIALVMAAGAAAGVARRSATSAPARDHAGGAAGERAVGGSGLVTLEIALATVLLAGAGLLVRSYDQLTRISPGYETEDLVTARLNLDGERFRDREGRVRAIEAIVDRVAALPGVEGVVLWGPNRFGYGWEIGFVSPTDRATESDADRIMTGRHHVGAGALRTLGLPLVAGREFEVGDRAETEPVAMLSATLARTLWPDGSALGREIVVNGGRRRVVGIAADALHRFRRNADEPLRDVYLPYAQLPARSVILGVRTAAGAGVEPALRRAVGAVDPDLPLYDVSTLEAQFEREGRAEGRLRAVAAGYAALAVTLAMVGVHAVLSTVVAARRREMAIRAALGAHPAALARLILGQAARWAGTGVALGLLAATLAKPAWGSILFRTSAVDPGVFGLAAAGLVVAILLIGLGPGRRAARLDVVASLRD